MRMEEKQVSSGSAARTGGLEDSESSVANQTPDDSGTREAPAHSVGHYEDVALSSDSGRDRCPSDDSKFSFEGDRDLGGFVSRRELVCFGYLYGRARVTLRQYDIMREADNSFIPTEKMAVAVALAKTARAHVEVCNTPTTGDDNMPATCWKRESHA